MTQISKRALNKSIENKMYQVFWNALSKINNPEWVSSFLNDIFTPTEKVMITKRLAIALLLNREWSQESIRDTLKVSTSTVQSIKSTLRWRGNGYRKVIKQIDANQEWAIDPND